MQLSRWLGYRSNVVHTWEAGTRFPTAAVAFRVARKVGVDVDARLQALFGPAACEVDLATAAGVAHLLRELRGAIPIGEIARRAGYSRYAVARWLKGTTQPRLPELLAMVEATSLRLLDFVSALCDPAALPEVAGEWAALERSRSLASEMPWSHAVLRALELERYAELPGHEPGWIAARIGVDLEEEARCLAALSDTGQIRWDGQRYRLDRVRTVDTRLHPEAGRRLKRWWAEVGLARLEAGDDGLFSYNLFTVSEADLERLRELHLRYFRALRVIVADSEPGQRVAVVNMQLFDLATC